MASRVQEDLKWLKKSLEYHKGKWLTVEAVLHYRKLGAQLRDFGNYMSGERRNLCLQLMDEYGVTEIEAFNIVNGYGGMDYVAKYERIRTQTPLRIVDKPIWHDEEDML